MNKLLSFDLSENGRRINIAFARATFLASSLRAIRAPQLSCRTQAIGFLTNSLSLRDSAQNLSRPPWRKGILLRILSQLPMIRFVRRFSSTELQICNLNVWSFRACRASTFVFSVSLHARNGLQDYEVSCGTHLWAVKHQVP